jgi:hypothetical protein
MPSAGDKIRASDILVRCGCRVRRAAVQSISSGAATAISWDTEDQDTDGFITVTASVVTIPTGKGGLYQITAHLVGTGITGSGAAIILDVTSSPTGYPADFLSRSTRPATVAASPSASPLSAGDTFNVQAFHATGSAVDFTGWLSCYRVGV